MTLSPGEATSNATNGKIDGLRNRGTRESSAGARAPPRRGRTGGAHALEPPHREQSAQGTAARRHGDFLARLAGRISSGASPGADYGGANSVRSQWMERDTRSPGA